MDLGSSKLKSFIFGAVTISAAFVCASLAHASIPSSRTILGRVARNDGKGFYSIEQDVIFHTAGEPVVLRERWFVENGDRMRLTVFSPKSADKSNDGDTRFDIVYQGGRRTAPDLKGGLKTGSVPTEFVEGFSHIRSTQGLVNALIRAGIVSNDFSSEKNRWTPAKKDATPQPEPFVRLGRYAGVVNYVFGEPTPVEAKKAWPGVWIEQDAFLMRKLRFPSEAEVVYDRHAAQGASLRLARERTISWDNNTVEVRVTSIKPVAASQVQKFLEPASLTGAEAKAAHLPDLAQVREFYSRFR